ncbi:NADH-quinone oxidoreductase subunit C [Kitasatospora sp. NPDC049258]|uniref:NADH-quinone oxidoreductase subunit C n=1 Tax=Kitasatospora sp. NPDC049258 TaxID=3155394 RepID=UPI0034242469
MSRTPEETAAAIGEWATAAEAYQLLTVDVPAEHWIEALTAARDRLGLSYFDWLSAVDELADGYSVCAHLAALGEPAVRHLLLRTRIPRDKAVLPTAVQVYAGAGWHERETHEMFGIDFAGHPHLITLLLPDGFEGHPLRKDFVLAARVAKAWPGAKEPGESEGDGPARRKMQPPGVPDPNEWGPLKGTLPPVAERPARGARAGAAARTPRAAAAAAEGAAGEVRPRRARSVEAGSVSQPEAGAAEAPEIRADRPRRTRSVGEGSASQAAAPAAPAEAAQAAEAPAAPGRPARTRSSDAPWHSPVPAHGPAEPEPGTPEAAETPEAPEAPEPQPESPQPGTPQPGTPQPETPQPGTSQTPDQDGDSA